MGKILQVNAEAFEEERLANVGLLAGYDGELIGPSGVLSWALSVYDLTAGSTTTPVFALLNQNPALVLFPQLVLDGFWDYDDEGYNFLHILDMAAASIQGGRNYRLEYVFTTSAYGPVTMAIQLRVREVMSL